jgi:hypothetical protein
MRPDARRALVAELKRLSNRELKRTLSQLDPDECAHVLALIEQADQPRQRPTFETLVGLSPWLLKAIDEAKAISGHRHQALTPATREALLRALDRLSVPDKNSMPIESGSGGTFIGRLIARRKSRAVAA